MDSNGALESYGPLLSNAPSLARIDNVLANLQHETSAFKPNIFPIVQSRLITQAPPKAIGKKKQVLSTDQKNYTRLDPQGSSPPLEVFLVERHNHASIRRVFDAQGLMSLLVFYRTFSEKVSKKNGSLDSVQSFLTHLKRRTYFRTMF